MERLPITNDFVFKRIYAKKGNEEILKDLLISILEIPIEKVEVIAEANLERKLEKDKLGILDIKAILDDKTIVNIEVQVINYYNMVERSLFYWSALYHESLKAGESFEKNKRVITINLLNFKLFEEGTFHEIGRLKRDYENILLTKQLELHFIQMPKFSEGNKEVNRKLRQWMYFISNQNKGEIEMEIKENKEIEKANEELEYLSGDEEARRLAYLREKALRDEANNLIGAREEGIKQGAKEKEIEIAKKMLQENVDIGLIEKITELTREEIERLK